MLTCTHLNTDSYRHKAINPNTSQSGEFNRVQDLMLWVPCRELQDGVINLVLWKI